jgi:hypothetical protein
MLTAMLPGGSPTLASRATTVEHHHGLAESIHDWQVGDCDAAARACGWCARKAVPKGTRSALEAWECRRSARFVPSVRRLLGPPPNQPRSKITVLR